MAAFSARACPGTTVRPVNGREKAHLQTLSCPCISLGSSKTVPGLSLHASGKWRFRGAFIRDAACAVLRRESGAGHTFQDEELKRLSEKEDAEEQSAVEGYRRSLDNVRNYPEERVMKARQLIAEMIRAEEEIEEVIERAGKEGQLDEVVLMVIKTRLEVARHDNERDVIEALDLLYRRIEAEMAYREASPAMRLLNELLQLQDSQVAESDWLRECQKRMKDTFPPEDAMGFIVPAGIDLSNHYGPIEPTEEDDLLLRVDFVRDVRAFLKGVEKQADVPPPEGWDPQSVALRLKHEETVKAINQVRQLHNLAAKLKW